MPPGNQPLAMVCRCGKTLRLTGARAGRVGRCPTCGSTFRVPEAPARPAPSPSEVSHQPNPPRRPRREVWEDNDPGPPGGYGLAPLESRPLDAGPTSDSPTTNPVRVAARGSTSRERDPIARGGIAPLPRKPERNPLVSLLYPLWDANGLAWLVLLPPLMTAITLCVFALIPIVLAGGTDALYGPFAFAMIVPFSFGVAYVLAIFADALTESAQGESAHPRWPDLSLGTIFLSLVRWGLALGIGVAPLIPLALAYWRAQPAPGLTDRVVVALILSAGGLYGLMAVLSLYLHDDLLALKPSMVLGGALRVGLGYLVAVLALSTTAVLGTLIVSGLYRLDGFPAVFLGTWGAWVFAIYAGLVVVRLLGVAYHRRARRVGWFPSSRRPKDVPLGPPPAPIPDA